MSRNTFPEKRSKASGVVYKTSAPAFLGPLLRAVPSFPDPTVDGPRSIYRMYVLHAAKILGKPSIREG